MQRAFYFLFFIPFLACQPSAQKTEEKQSVDSTQTTISRTDSSVIDLVEKKVTLGKSETIAITNDPVFHKDKTFEAIPLVNVLKQIPAYASLKPEETQVVFECEDGYNPSMPLTKVINSKAYLAIRDKDAPAGEDWTTLQKGPETKKIAPFYICYTDVKGDDPSYKWPYNLVRISLTSASKETAALFPKNDDSVVKGYGLFKTHCLTCHALNGVGGTLGPELNKPKSVTEYWKSEDLKAFIANPASYRDRVKMPNLGLKKKEIEEIVGYLSYMAKQ